MILEFMRPPDATTFSFANSTASWYDLCRISGKSFIQYDAKLVVDVVFELSMKIRIERNKNFLTPTEFPLEKKTS